MKNLLISLLLSVILTPQIEWKQLADGLEITEYKSPIKSAYDDSKITVLKINPKVYKFNLYSYKDRSTAEQFASKHSQVATINAGMYQSNGTNCGYMKDYDVYNNPKMNKDRAILAFNSIDDSVPPIQIIDTEFQDWNELKTKYHSFTQSIRMVDLNGKNKWSVQDKMWSIACIAMDKDGNILFIHSRSPYRVSVFIDIMLAAPFNIKNMMYLEGGPEASLFVAADKTIYRKVGSYETNFIENNDNLFYWKIPNVIGISKIRK